MPITRTRATKLVAAISLAIVTTLSAGGTAHAVPAHQTAQERITETIVTMSYAQNAHFRRYFNDMTTDGMLATPDGRGGFAFYRGSAGDGAIYTSNDCSYIFLPGLRSWCTARAVYGPILASWGASGWETVYGYPRTDAYTRTTGNQGLCPVGQIEQRFLPIDGKVNYHACWSGTGSTVTWRAEVR